MTDTPHFKVPFQIQGSKVAEVEQDTDEEIIQGVETVLRTPKGHYVDSPDFGIPDQAFQQSKIDKSQLERSVRESEPRADYVLQELDRTDWLTSRVGIQIVPKGENNGQ